MSKNIFWVRNFHLIIFYSDASSSEVESYEFQLPIRNESFLNTSHIMAYPLHIFHENFSLGLRKLENVHRNSLLIENADVHKSECYWLWATPNASAILNNCNNEMVSARVWFAQRTRH